MTELRPRSRLQRKWLKFRRDPASFFADAKSPILRKVGLRALAGKNIEIIEVADAAGGAEGRVAIIDRSHENTFLVNCDTSPETHDEELEPQSPAALQDGRLDFHADFAPRVIGMPLILYSDLPWAHYSGDVPRIQQLVARALAATNEPVFFLGDPDFKDVLAEFTDERFEFVTCAPERLPTAFHAILEERHEPRFGLWHLNISPAICVWPMLETTLNEKASLAIAGVSLLSENFQIFSAGHSVSATGEVCAQYAGRHYLTPGAFRFHDCQIVDISLCAIDTKAWIEAFSQIAGSMPEGGLQAIANNLCVEFLRGHRRVGVQGCAIGRMVSDGHTAPENATPRFSGDAMMDFTKNSEKAAEREIAVIIDSMFPTPDRDAGSVTALHIAKMLLERGMEVNFFANAEQEFNPKYTTLFAFHGVSCAFRPFYENFDQFVEHMVSKSNRRITFFLNRVYCGGQFFERIRRLFPRARVVFNTVDLHGLREMREAELNRNSADHFSAQATLIREKNLVQQSDATIVLSDHEHAILSAEFNYANIHVVPMVNDFSKNETGYHKRRDILFIGGFNHPPNADAVNFFINEVWSEVRRSLPGVRFKIAGPNFPDYLQSGLPDDVDLLGFVEDLPALLETVRLTVAPLRYGAGIKGKVGTSLSHGVPCVATPAAAEGMGLVNDVDVLVAEDSQTLADQIVRLYTDRNLWDRLSTAGFEFCEKHYSHEAVAKNLEMLFQSLNARTSHTPPSEQP